MAAIISLAQVKRAYRTAKRDFKVCGLWTDKLHAVPIRWTLAAKGYGFYDKGGAIVIPQVAYDRLGQWFGQRRVALTDVLRHELAHALAHVHADLLDSPWFKQAFGASHGHKWRVEPAFDPNWFVSNYATLSPAEDFAETVKIYTRHRAKLTRYERRAGVMAKFDFVGCLASGLEDVAD